MYATMSATVKRTIFSLAFGIGLILAGPAEVPAHTVDVRPGFVRIHYGRGGDVILPRRLLGHRDFQHWYWHHRYRFKRHVGWARVYEIYRFERRHRWRSRFLRRDQYHKHGHRGLPGRGRR